MNHPARLSPARGWRHLASVALASVLVAAFFIHCQELVLPVEEKAEVPAPQFSAPFDVNAVVRGVSLRFRSTPGGYENVRPTFRAGVSPTGRLTLDALEANASSVSAASASSLAVETLRVTRGARDLSGDSRTVLAQDGAVHVERGAVREVLASSESGVEQSWTFQELPAGEGVLRVEVAVSGQSFRAPSSQGLHFSATPEGPGWRYGLATWVDADGMRTGLTPRYENGRIVLEVPAEVLERSRYPATLDPLLSPERSINEPVLWPEQGHQRTPAVATDGTNFLVVWDSDGEIRAARVTPSGQVLDPAGFLVSSRDYFKKSVPAVAFNGTQYLIVWQDKDNSSDTDLGNILGARVSASGVVLDTTPRTICATTASQLEPAVATDGTDFFVAWEDRRGTTNPDIYGTVVRANGTVLAPNGVALTTAPGGQQDVTIAYGGGSYLVAWADTSVWDIRAARVSNANAVLARDLPIATGNATQSSPMLAFDGTRFLAVWRNSDTSPSKLEGLRLDATAVPVDATPTPYVTTLDYNYPGSRLTFTGSYYLLAWGDSRGSTQGTNIYAARIQRDGLLVDPQGILVGGGPGYQQAPAVAGNSFGAFVVWQSDTDTFWEPRDIHGARLGNDGAVLDVPPRVISLEYAAQSQPALGFDGTNYLLTWMEQHGEDEGLYATRVTQDGQVLDPAGIRLDAPSDSSYLVPTHVAFNGQHYLVTWDGTRGGASGIMGVRIRPDGTVLDPLPLQLATFAPGGRVIEGGAVASDGQDFFLAYAGPGPGSNRMDVYGVRILSNGTRATATDTVIVAQLESQYEVQVTYDGQRYVVVWTDSRDFGAGYPEVYGRKVERDGITLLPEFEIVPRTNSTPVLASNGQGALVVWESGGSQLYGQMLAQDGTLGPSFCIACLEGYDQRASVTFDGTHYVVAWQNGSIYSTPTNAGVYMARVRTNGTVVDTTPIPIATGMPQEEFPRIVSNGNGGALIAYTRSGAPAVPAVSRVVLRISTELALGAACTQNRDCRSNFCVDGVCCDSACGNGAEDCQACSVARGATQDGVCTVLPAQALCRAGRSQACDVAERCDGVSPLCPEDVMVDAGTPCSDGNACTQGESCSFGYCWGSQSVACNNPGVCQAAGSCEPSTGECVYPPLPDGTWCGAGWCSAGSCEPIVSADGGISTDGGTGVSDGGLPGDGGLPRDGGGSAPDAGGRPGDGGTLPIPPPFPPGPPAPPAEESGCGCTQASGASLWAVLSLVLLAARRRGTAL